MSKCRTIKDAFPLGLAGGGIFSAFSDPVWANDFNATELDLTFILKYGERLQGSILRYFDAQDASGEYHGLSPANVQRVAALIYAHFSGQFDHLYNDYKAEYDPIENYNSTESVTDTRTGQTSDSQTHERETSDSDTLTRTMTASNETGIYGFNSADSVPANDATNTGSESTSDTRTGTDDLTITGTGSSSESGTELRTRRGNIGVTTSAQMLTGDTEFWKWNFMTDVMNMIASFISLKIY